MQIPVINYKSCCKKKNELSRLRKIDGKFSELQSEIGIEEKKKM